MSALTKDTPLADSPGQGLIRLDLVGTAAFVVVTAVASLTTANAA